MKIRLILMLGLCCYFTSSVAQFDGLKKKLLDKGKKALTGNVEQSRTKLDSSDFNCAISVIDNSGMMSIRDANEGAIKKADILINSGNTGLRDKSDVTPEQKCRGDLDIAEEFYDRKRLKWAENAFITAKQSYESNNLKDNINY